MFQKLTSLFKKRRSPGNPQLEMLRENLDNLPEITIPDGYELRSYQPGDEASWCEIMEGNVGQNWTVEKCREKIIEDSRFLPENLIFITHGGDPVASVCAWRKPIEDRTVGQIHMVAALESHRGNGLGHLLNAAVLHRLKALGFQQADLKTDEWRLAAIKSYITADFHPRHTHESHPERWKRVYKELGLPESEI